MENFPTIKNGFLFVTFLSTAFIIACIVNNTVRYIDLGFITFLYSYLAYFANIFFQKTEIFANVGRKKEFFIQLSLLIIWIGIIVWFYVY